MTLNTVIYITTPVDRWELYGFCMRLLDPEPGRYTLTVDENGIDNLLGQGLDGILRIEAKERGTTTAADPGELPAVFYARVSFDTAYGYRNDIWQWGPRELHAWYIKQMVRRYGNDGVQWINESSAERFQGTDGLMVKGGVLTFDEEAVSPLLRGVV